jgi:hypothetical protein
MYPKTIAALVLLAVTFHASAQNAEPAFSLKDRFISSAGLTFPRTNHFHHDEQLYGLTYSPSLNLLNKLSDFSVAIASQVSAAYHIRTIADPENYMMISFPAYMRFNIGHLATHNFYSSLGIFFGAGYDFSVINSGFDSGPLLITAIRFWFLKQSFTLGYGQTHLQNSNTTMHEVSLQLNIGAYLHDTRNNNKISKFVKPFRK